MSNKKLNLKQRQHEIKKREVGISMQPESLDKEKRELTLSFASQEPCLVWGESEILTVNEDAMDTSRFANGVMPTLFNHNRDNVIARVAEIWIESNIAYAKIVFDTDELSQRIMDKIESGSVRGVSVGYRVRSYERVEANAKSSDGFAGPCWIARNWEVLEISVVSIPADSNVGVRAADDDEDQEFDDEEKVCEDDVKKEDEEKQKGVKQMTQEEVAKQRQEAEEKERKRCSEIVSLCRDFGIDNEVCDQYLSNKRDITSVKDEILKLQREKMTGTRAPVVQVDKNDEMRRRQCVDGILLRSGKTVKDAVDGSRRYQTMRIRDVFQEILEGEGVTARELRGMHDDDLLKRAMTSSSLQSIVSNVANKALSIGYAETQTTYKKFTTVGSVTDFKTVPRFRISAAGQPYTIPESGEFTYDQLMDESYNTKADTHGIGWSFTRQAMINDDLGALTKLPAAYAAAFERKKNQMCYAALALPANYSTQRGNIISPGTALSVESLGAGQELMRNQKDMSGRATLNIPGRYLIVPSALEVKARQILASFADPAAAHAGVINPFQGAFEPVVDSTLNQYSTKSWYLVCEKNAVDGIEVSYLNGIETPFVEMGTDFNILGFQFRMYHDFGITVGDYRGLVKNVGV